MYGLSAHETIRATAPDRFINHGNDAPLAMRPASAATPPGESPAACRASGPMRMSLAAKGFFLAATTGTARRFG
jgi:hypothetical protein